jgi:uncharacterized membrane protein YeaQ/YmgE (transglycosylase-associated protein family)
MKQFSWIWILILAASAGALAQTLPDNPAPSDPTWARVQSLTFGQAIVVDDTNGPPVRCFFTSATDAYLFCNPPGDPVGVGYRFNRVDILGVDLDLPGQKQVRASHRERNYHPKWLASMIAGGIVVGLCATHSTDAGGATKAGLIGAVVVGAIGAPLAFLPNRYAAGGRPSYPQAGISIPLRFHHWRMPSTARSDE